MTFGRTQEVHEPIVHRMTERRSQWGDPGPPGPVPFSPES